MTSTKDAGRLGGLKTASRRTAAQRSEAAKIASLVAARQRTAKRLLRAITSADTALSAQQAFEFYRSIVRTIDELDLGKLAMNEASARFSASIDATDATFAKTNKAIKHFEHAAKRKTEKDSK